MAGWTDYLLLGCIATIVQPHPQCLDFSPPSNPKWPLFCDQYTELTCCSQQQDKDKEKMFKTISVELSEHKLDLCNNYIRELICQPCSPYAAHMYAAEGTSVPRTFPGLCPFHCSVLETVCPQALQILLSHVSPELVGENLCDKLVLQDKSHCYPNSLYPHGDDALKPLTFVNSQDCLCFEEVASGFRTPVSLQYTDDESGRLFIVQQVGIISVMYENKTRVAEPFLDIRKQTTVEQKPGDERGFLGLAFHPQFSINGRFFVLYFTDEGGNKTRLSEFGVSPADPHKAEPDSERILLEIKQPFLNHNAGELFFGDDGCLYISTGDGGAAGDPYNNAQNKSSLLGKLLRIDVDQAAGESPADPSYLPYSSPDPPNPFKGHPNARMEIFAYGLRNPWRCSVDRGDQTTGYGRGRIFCADVGQDAIEEIDIIQKGGNYGWRAWEGLQCYDRDSCESVGPVEPPIYSYNHSIGKSVTGGYVYRGCQSPQLSGLYLYGDYTAGKLFKLSEDVNNNKWENREVDICGPKQCNNGLTSSYKRSIMAFGEDSKGEIYFMAADPGKTSMEDGTIYKIVDPKTRWDTQLCLGKNE